MERTYGKQYDQQKTVKEIAAEIRTTIKAEVKAGRLPPMKYSVRYQTFAGGRSIDINVEAVTVAQCMDLLDIRWLDAQARNPHRYYEGGQYSLYAQGILRTLEAMQGSHNHDGSDSQTDHFDVKFYGHAQLRFPTGTHERLVESRRDAIATGGGDELVQPMSDEARAVCSAAFDAVRKVTVKRNVSGTAVYWSLDASPVARMTMGDATRCKVAETWFDSSDEAAQAARAVFPKALIAV